MGVGETHSLLREAIEMGRADLGLGVVAAGISPPEIIRQDQDDVRLAPEFTRLLGKIVTGNLVAREYIADHRQNETNKKPEPRVRSLLRSNRHSRSAWSLRNPIDAEPSPGNCGKSRPKRGTQHHKC